MIPEDINEYEWNDQIDYYLKDADLSSRYIGPEELDFIKSWVAQKAKEEGIEEPYVDGAGRIFTEPVEELYGFRVGDLVKRVAIPREEQAWIDMWSAVPEKYRDKVMRVERLDEMQGIFLEGEGTLSWHHKALRKV